MGHPLSAIGYRFVVLLLLALATCTAKDDRPTVVLYVSADEYVARQVIDAFEAQTGIRVKFVGDTEAKKTTGLIERLRAERNNPQADVFWSSEIFQTVELADDGILAAHRSDATAAWPEAYSDPDGRWYGFAGRARVIVYAPDRVNKADVPRSWSELSQPRWRGRIVMADPRFGTTGGHLGAMKWYWDRHDPGAYERLLQGLRANDVRLLPGGNASVVRAVAEGQADIGLTDTDDVWAYRAQHGPLVDLVYPAHGPDAGTLLIPNTAAVVSGAPHPQEAALLLDFLLSSRVEQMLAESVSRNVPLGPDRPGLDPQWAVPEPVEVDFVGAAEQRAGAVAGAMDAAGNGQPSHAP
jgi:iron(III) transport system substrate-binding protein